jgi:hypothetical protein
MFRRFKTTEEISGQPGFSNEVNQGEEFDQLLGDYKLNRKKVPAIKCGRAQCRQPHWYGFVAHTKSGKVVPVGNVCGTTLFGAAFDSAREAFAAEIARQTREEEAARRFARTREIRDRATRLLENNGRVEKFERAMQSLAELCSRRIIGELHDRAVRRLTAIEIERERTKSDAPQIGGKSSKFITELVGHFEGLQVFNAPTPRALLHDQLLSGIGRYDDSTAGYLASSKVHYRQHLEWVSRLEDILVIAEARLEAAKRFFRTPNLRLLGFLAQTAEERMRMPLLTWNEEMGRVNLPRAAAALRSSPASAWSRSWSSKSRMTN